MMPPKTRGTFGLSMASPARDLTSRLFNASDNLNLAESGRTAIHDPSEITTFNPMTQVTKLKFYHSSEQFSGFTVDEASIVVAIGRDCGKDMHGNSKVTFSMYFGPESKYNTSQSIPQVARWGELAQTYHAAELYAFGQTINSLRWLRSRLGVSRAIIITRSSYIAKGFSENITRWSENGWKDNKGKKIKNAAAFQWIHNDLDGMQSWDNVDVQIWLVNKEQNSEADMLAKEAISCQPVSCSQCKSLQLQGTATLNQNTSPGPSMITSPQGTNVSNNFLLSSTHNNIISTAQYCDSGVNLPSTLGGYSTMHQNIQPLNLAMPCFQFWVSKARHSPAARQLCSELAIQIPTRRPDDYSVMDAITVIRRLVVVGEDRPANFAILFGPQWPEVGQGHPELSIKMFWLECRLQILLCPAPGSIAYIMGEKYDKTAPRWTPRGPSTAEEEMLRAMNAREQPSEACTKALAIDYALP